MRGNRWPLLALLTSAYGLGAFGMLGVSPLTPSLVEGFHLSRLDVAFIVPCVYLPGLFFSLPAGHLADRLGVRPTFLGGLALAAAGLALAAAAPRFWLFLACLVVAGAGWSVVNPVLGKAIVDLFPVRERGIAMGIKQMGLTVGGVISALVLPPIAALLGWRAAIATCALVIAAPALTSWRPLAPLADARGGTVAAPAADDNAWFWLKRPALLVFFATGVALGMLQSAVLAYLPLYGVQVLGWARWPRASSSRWPRRAAPSRAWGWARRAIAGWAAGAPPGSCSPPCSARSRSRPTRSRRCGRRSPRSRWAFVAGVGAHGWVGVYFIASAEAGGPHRSGLLSGVAFGAIVLGLLVGAPVFGMVLVSRDSYGAAWAVFAALAAGIALVMALAGEAIHRERARAGNDKGSPASPWAAPAPARR